MKRKSDINQLHTYSKLRNDEISKQTVRRQVKRNYTTLIRKEHKSEDQNSQKYLSSNFKRFQYSKTIVNILVNQIVNSLEKDIQKVEKQRMIRMTLSACQVFEKTLNKFEDPENPLIQINVKAEQEPSKNQMDPISGFNKQNFIKKSISRHIEPQIIKQQAEVPAFLNTRKLPSLMKHLSDQKLKNLFIPLQDNILNTTKKITNDFQDMARQRMFKQIQNRRNKQRMQAKVHLDEDLKKAKSNHEFNKTFTKQDMNYDYDGNKIEISNLGRIKSNLNILKTLYKIPQDRPQNLKQVQKKYQQKLAFLPRASKQFLQSASRTITYYGQINHSMNFKQKIETQLKKVQLKYREKQYSFKEKERKAPLN